VLLGLAPRGSGTELHLFALLHVRDSDRYARGPRSVPGDANATLRAAVSQLVAGEEHLRVAEVGALTGNGTGNGTGIGKGNGTGSGTGNGTGTQVLTGQGSSAWDAVRISVLAMQCTQRFPGAYLRPRATRLPTAYHHAAMVLLVLCGQWTDADHALDLSL